MGRGTGRTGSAAPEKSPTSHKQRTSKARETQPMAVYTNGLYGASVQTRSATPGHQCETFRLLTRLHRSRVQAPARLRSFAGGSHHTGKPTISVGSVRLGTVLNV